MRYLLIPAFAALVAVLPLPLDAYQLIRWIVSGTCAYALISTFHECRRIPEKYIPVVIVALVYNPLVPFYLSRSLWIAIDVVTGPYLMWLAFSGSRWPQDARLGVQETLEATKFGPSIEEAPPTVRVSSRVRRIEKRADSFAWQLLGSAVVTIVCITVLSYLFRK